MGSTVWSWWEPLLHNSQLTQLIRPSFPLPADSVGLELAHCAGFTLPLHSIWARVQGGKFPLSRRAGGCTSVLLKMEKQACLFLGNCIFFFFNEENFTETGIVSRFFSSTSQKRRNVSNLKLLKLLVKFSKHPAERRCGFPRKAYEQGLQFHWAVSVSQGSICGTWDKSANVSLIS